MNTNSIRSGEMAKGQLSRLIPNTYPFQHVAF